MSFFLRVFLFACDLSRHALGFAFVCLLFVTATARQGKGFLARRASLSCKLIGSDLMCCRFAYALPTSQGKGSFATHTILWVALLLAQVVRLAPVCGRGGGLGALGCRDAPVNFLSWPLCAKAKDERRLIPHKTAKHHPMDREKGRTQKPALSQSSPYHYLFFEGLMHQAWHGWFVYMSRVEDST